MSDQEATGGIENGCWTCADPVNDLKRLFVDVAQAGDIRRGQSPAQRPVFTRTHGVARGHLEMLAGLREDLKVGVFAHDGFDAWVRFSSDPGGMNTDFKTTSGIAIKLFGVPGEKLLGDGDTQDFLMQNYPAFFVDDATDMCAFTRAGLIDDDSDAWLASHPRTKEILNDMQKAEVSVLTTTFWSVLPYAFGAGRYVKYKLEPEALPDSVPDSGNPNYLGADLARRLRRGDARFRFLVQFFEDEARTPLDRATVEWKSAWVQLATLTLPRQDIGSLGQAGYGENLAFNPWHALKVHEPQGSISAARKVTYAASAELRRNANGVPTREPGPARTAEALSSTEDDHCIVRAAIYPSIGIARVGSSEEEWFIGPEVTDPAPAAPGFYRDKTGALKRQAARFRVYGLNAEGGVVAELTADNAEIRWTVHVANKKAAWFQFQLAQDIPEAASAPPQLLRNAAVDDRSKLAIDPGPRDVSGRNQSGGALKFDTGKFMDVLVYLGELRTDDAGRLIVLGGHGKSASSDGAKAVTFANNEGWHDDVSDGPVTATVQFRGKELEVAPAWVVTAPPNYAPLQKSVRTMWDLMRDVAVKAGTLTRPLRPSFDRDIRPIFERLSRLQWVNAGFAAGFGWGAPNDFGSPQLLARLASNGADGQEMRQVVANSFRLFDRDAWAPGPWPWVYGDAMNIPTPPTPRAFGALSDTQLAMLQQWVNGDFDADYDPERAPPRTIDDVPVAEQGDMLTRAALQFCLADAFHPGCEMTWPMRQATLYKSAFRIKHAEAGWVEPEYGTLFTQDLMQLDDGPFAGQVAGGITRWMAVPWQTDTASCSSGYTRAYDPYLPTFWPARVPNQVLSARNYDIVVDESRPLGERLAAFASRADWRRPLLKPLPNGDDPDYTVQINRLAADISQMGVVETRKGLDNDTHFPAVFEVEELPSATLRAFAGSRHGEITRDPTDFARTAKARRFPQGLKSFR
jgi:L-Lysine epsilon oxidase N-terminal/L-lysine epsilon oxidase C-terminal domain